MSTSRIKAIAPTFLACLFLGAFAASGQITAHYINVGQAASALVEFPSGAILIDAGGEDTGGGNVYGAHLVQYLKTFFKDHPSLNDTLDAVIISHPHIDHTMSLMDVMQNFTVRTLVDNGGASGSGIVPLDNARAFAKSHGIDYIAIGNARISKRGKQLDLLASEGPGAVPKILAMSGLRGCENLNNDSITIRIEMGAASLLFAGDAENEADKECDAEIGMLEDRFNGTPLLKATVLHVPHHGSFNGTSDDFLKLVTPQISVISAGDPDRHKPGVFHAWEFGHPRAVAVTTLENDTSGTRPAPKSVVVLPAVKKEQTITMSKAVYCTCWDGDVVVTFAGPASAPTVSTDNFRPPVN
jgi:competence protein ComEC